MAPLSFLPFFLFFFHFVTVQSVIYGLKGQQVQFDPDITGQPEQILWRHNGKVIVEFNGYEAQVFGSYKGRVTLSWHSAQLQISDLRLEDSGKYDYEIYIGGKPFRQSYELEVIEKVAKPTITCQKNSDSSSTVSAVLLCSVELSQPQSSLKFGWSSKGNVQYGQWLTIFLGGELDEEEYTCRVSNPQSSETATFRAKDCHTDAGLSPEMIDLIGLISIPIVIVCVILLILLWRRIDAGSSAEVIFGIVLFLLLIVHMGLVILLWRLKHKNAGSSAGMIALIVILILIICVGLLILLWRRRHMNPERQQREAKSHAESDSSNSPNMAPQDTDGEHNNDASADYKSDSSCQGKQDKSDNSPTRDIQQPTNPGPTGSEATQDEKDPNLSRVSD